MKSRYKGLVWITGLLLLSFKLPLNRPMLQARGNMSLHVKEAVDLAFRNVLRIEEMLSWTIASRKPRTKKYSGRRFRRSAVQLVQTTTCKYQNFFSLSQTRAFIKY